MSNQYHPDVLRDNIVSISIKDCIVSFIELEDSVAFGIHDYLDSFFFACASGSLSIVEYLIKKQKIPYSSSTPGIIQAILNEKFTIYETIKIGFTGQGFNDKLIIPYLMFTISDNTLFNFILRYDVNFSKKDLESIESTIPIILFNKLVFIYEKAKTYNQLQKKLSKTNSSNEKNYKI